MSLRIIGASIGHGAQDPDSQNAPDVVRLAGLATVIEREALRTGNERFDEASWDTTLYPHFAKGFRKDLPIVGDFSERLRKVVARVHADGSFPLVVGGDHSCAIGTWSGVASALRDEGRGPLGLVWVDAHLDSHTFETTPSGAIHGMPLACLLGHGQRLVAQCGGFSPKIDASRTTVLGARSWEDGEPELLEHLGVRVIPASECRRRGFESVLSEAVSRASSGPWGMTLDMDAFDPSFVPSVCSPETGGIDPSEFVSALRALRISRDPLFRAFEIAEYAPAHDVDGKGLAVLLSVAEALVA